MGDQRRFAYYTHETQRLANKLPQWHAGRQRRDSLFHTLLNASYGIQFSRYRSSFSNYSNNSFLETSILNQVDIVSKCEIPADVVAGKEVEQYNIIKNSNFHYNTSMISVADGWDSDGKAYTGLGGLFGPNSLYLVPESLTTTTVSKFVELANTSGETLNLSFYVKIEEYDSSGMTLPTTNFGLMLTVTYEDATTEDFHVPIDSFHTGGQWRRFSSVINPTKRVASSEVFIIVENTAAFPITTEVAFDGVQMSIGTALRKYVPNILDTFPYIQTLNPPPNFFFIDSDRPVYRVVEAVDFWDSAIPTAVGLVKKRDAVDPVPQDVSADEFVDFWGYEFNTKIRLNNVAKTITLYNSDVDGVEDYFEASLKMRDGSLEYVDAGYDTLEAGAGINSWLFLIGNKVNTKGDMVKTISVVNPRLPIPYPDNVQIMNTIELPIDSSEVVISAEFRFDDQQHIYISTATDEYIIRLYYDYYQTDYLSGFMYMRELYNRFVVF